MTVKKGDFIELEFTGKIKSSNEIFDTNVKSVVDSEKLDVKEVKPFVLSVGSAMLPLGFDEDLIGKEVGKNYVVDITAEKAFGKRDKALIKMIPTKLFLEQKIRPERGMQLSLDGQMVKIISVSSGRTLVDFNNPLTGKDIIYEYKILKEINDENEKINGLQDFLFKKRFEFEVKGNKVVFSVEKAMEPYMKMFSGKFKEIIGKEIDVIVKAVAKKENSVRQVAVGSQ